MMKRILCKLFVVALAAGFMSVMSVSAQSQDTGYKALLQELMEASGSLKSVQQMIPQMLAPLKEQMPELTEESIGKLQGAKAGQEIGKSLQDEIKAVLEEAAAR